MLKKLEIDEEKMQEYQTDDTFWLIGSKYGRDNNHIFIFLSEAGEFRYHTVRDYYPFFVVKGLDVTTVQHRIEEEYMSRYVHDVYPRVMKNPITRKEEKVVIVETTAPYYVTNKDPNKSVSYIFDQENRYNNHVPYHHVVMNRYYEETGNALIMGYPYKFVDGTPQFLDEGVEDYYKFYEEVLEDTPEEELDLAYDLIELIHAKMPDFEKMIIASDIEIQVNEGESMDAEKAEVPITSISVTTFFETRVFTLDSEALGIPDSEKEFNDGTYEVEYFNSEKSLLHRFDEYINSEFGEVFLRLLMWYNGDEFDIPYIANRRDYHQMPETVVAYKKDSRYWYKKWEGMILLDLYAYFDNNNIRTGAYKSNYDNLKLDTISKAILDRGKYEYDGDIKNLSPQELAFYNAKDTQLTYDLATHDDNFPTFVLFFIMRFGNLSLENANRKGVTNWWGGFLYRMLYRRNMYYPNDGQLYKTSMKISGGEVLDAIVGIHRDISIIDFSSLYPTLMINKNIGYSTMNCEHNDCRKNTQKHLPKTGKAHVCQKRKGILSIALNFIRNARVKIYKPLGKEGDKYFSRLAQFIKIFMNACVERDTYVWAIQPREDTPILVQLDQVREGWKIQDGETFTEVIARNVVDSETGYLIETDVGELTVTPEHHMFTFNGHKEASEIEVGDYVRIANHAPNTSDHVIYADEFLPMNNYLYYIPKTEIGDLENMPRSIRELFDKQAEDDYINAGETKKGYYIDPLFLSTEEKRYLLDYPPLEISTVNRRYNKKFPHLHRYPTKIAVDRNLSLLFGYMIGGGVSRMDRDYFYINRRKLYWDEWLEVVDAMDDLEIISTDMTKYYDEGRINIMNQYYQHFFKYLMQSKNRLPILATIFDPETVIRGIKMASKSYFGEEVELDPVAHPFLRMVGRHGKLIQKDFRGTYLKPLERNLAKFIKVNRIKEKIMPNDSFIALTTESGKYTTMNGHHTSNCYGALKNAGFAFAHAQAAEYVTTSGRQAIHDLKEYIEEGGAEVIYGDSVRGREAVLVKIDNSPPLLLSIKQVWEIVNERFESEKKGTKTRVPVRDIQIWDGDEWNYVVAMLQHFSTKSLYRVSSGLGTVDVTEDHSLIDADGNKFRPEEIVDGKVPQEGIFDLSNRDIMAEDQVGFTKLMFLFSVCGTASKTSSGYPSQRTVALNFHQRVSNKGIEMLTSLQPIIDGFDAKYKTYVTKRGSTRVRFSSHQDLWASLRKTIYMDDEKLKPLPSVLGLPDDDLKEIYEFLKVYYMRKEDETEHDLRIIKSSTELVLFQTLSEYFGDSFVYYPLPRGDMFYVRESKDYDRKRTVSIINTPPEFVYDFETMNGTFVAGNIEVSNTDSVFVVGDVTYTDEELSEMLDLEVETEGFFKMLIQHGQKNYIKINKKKKIIMGMLGKKKNVPQVVKDGFKEAVDGIDPDFTTEEISKHVFDVFIRYENKIRNREVEMEDIMITQTLSRDLNEYSANTPIVQAVKNKKQYLRVLGDSRYKTLGKKGMIVDYIRTETERRWVPVEIADIKNMSVDYYIDRLHGAFYQLVNPLHMTIEQFKDEHMTIPLDDYF